VGLLLEKFLKVSKKMVFYWKTAVLGLFNPYLTFDVILRKLRLISLVFPGSKKYEKTRKLKNLWSFY